MKKTTVYLPTELDVAIKRVARQKGVSEAEVIRESIRAEVANVKPRPRGPLFASGDRMAERVDELLGGFGAR